MDQQQPTVKHRDIAGTIELPSSSWVKLVSIQKVLWPDYSKRAVVMDLIDDKHSQMLDDMGNMLGGSKP
jgi:hypothetical protein